MFEVLKLKYKGRYLESNYVFTTNREVHLKVDNFERLFVLYGEDYSLSRILGYRSRSD